MFSLSKKFIRLRPSFLLTACIPFYHSLQSELFFAANSNEIPYPAFLPYFTLCLFVPLYFRPLRNASPENCVSSCDCCDDDADDDGGALDVASKRRSPAGSDDLPGGLGYP